MSALLAIDGTGWETTVEPIDERSMSLHVESPTAAIRAA
jgi:hypothetical protein